MQSGACREQAAMDDVVVDGDDPFASLTAECYQHGERSLSRWQRHAVAAGRALPMSSIDPPHRALSHRVGDPGFRC